MLLPGFTKLCWVFLGFYFWLRTGEGPHISQHPAAPLDGQSGSRRGNQKKEKKKRRATTTTASERRKQQRNGVAVATPAPPPPPLRRRLQRRLDDIDPMMKEETDAAHRFRRSFSGEFCCRLLRLPKKKKKRKDDGCKNVAMATVKERRQGSLTARLFNEVEVGEGYFFLSLFLFFFFCCCCCCCLFSFFSLFFFLFLSPERPTHRSISTNPRFACHGIYGRQLGGYLFRYLYTCVRAPSSTPTEVGGGRSVGVAAGVGVVDRSIRERRRYRNEREEKMDSQNNNVALKFTLEQKKNTNKRRMQTEPFNPGPSWWILIKLSRSHQTTLSPWSPRTVQPFSPNKMSRKTV